MKRLFKLAATALVSALLVFLFAGCGEEEQPAARTTTTTRPSARAVAGSTGKVENLIGQTITPTDQTPSEVERSLQSKRPTVIFFYMSGPTDDNQVKSSMTTMESRFRGQVDFHSYLSSDSGRYGDLPTLLQINATPSVVCINKQGQVVRAWTGYVDQDSLEQGVVEATK